MASVFWSDKASLEDPSKLEDEFLFLMLLLSSAEESGSEDFYETNLSVEIEKTCLAERVLSSVRLSNCFS
jgi:hypothetical protein